MIRDFPLCHLLCRFFGGFLIQDFTPGSPRKARVTVKSSDTLYTTPCVSVVAFFEGGALAKIVACLLWLKCVAVHATFSNKSHAAFLTCLIGHTVHCSARFFELAFVSQCLRDEAQKLRESVRVTITCGVTDSYFKQMMVALIPYAVILLQTSNQLMQNVYNLNATSSAKLAAWTVIIQ
ncbi:hypothetical protein MRX96_024470 [Rhipicephalus microplus]